MKPSAFAVIFASWSGRVFGVVLSSFGNSKFKVNCCFPYGLSWFAACFGANDCSCPIGFLLSVSAFPLISGFIFGWANGTLFPEVSLFSMIAFPCSCRFAFVCAKDWIFPDWFLFTVTVFPLTSGFIFAVIEEEPLPRPLLRVGLLFNLFVVEASSLFWSFPESPFPVSVTTISCLSFCKSICGFCVPFVTCNSRVTSALFKPCKSPVSFACFVEFTVSESSSNVSSKLPFLSAVTLDDNFKGASLFLPEFVLFESWSLSVLLILLPINETFLAREPPLSFLGVSFPKFSTESSLEMIPETFRTFALASALSFLVGESFNLSLRSFFVGFWATAM